MGDKACLDRTWRLLKRRARKSEFVATNLKLARPSTANSEGMKRKNSRHNVEIPVTDYERFREERVAKNNECFERLGLANRKEKECKEKEEKEQVANKATKLPVRKSQRFFDPTNVVGEKGNCDDVEPDIAHGDVQLNEIHEESPLASDVPQSEPVVSGSTEDVSAFVKRKKLSQDLYRSTERHSKERILEGKKPFLVEVSRDGEPIGKNAARWASELGVRCRAHLDICKSNFAEQDPHHVESVIQKMENVFDTIGGQISRKYYKHKMRLLMNNFRYMCRKAIMEGKESLDNTLSPKQWEKLKESMHSEEYLTKSNKGKRARDSVKAEYTFGRGGLQAKINKFGVENNNREAGAEDIVNYMTELDPNKSKNSMKWKSSSSTATSQPSVKLPVRAPANHVNSNEVYEHIMTHLHSLTEKVSQLTSSVQPIVSSWNDHNFMNSYQNNCTKATQKQKHLDANKAADINTDHDELVHKNVQPDHSSVEAESKHMKAKQIAEDNDDGDCADFKQDVHDFYSTSNEKLEKCVDKLKEGDKVKVLDPYDGDVVGIGRIHSLSILHGINLKGSEDANVNILKVTSNVPLAYEDKIDGAVRLKEKEGTFTR